MANLISYVIAAGLLLGSYLAIAIAQRTYKNVLLTCFLALFVALPLVGAALKLKDGRPAFKNFMRALFSSAASLLVVTLVHQRFTKSWILACLAGMVLPGIVLAIQTAKTSQARLGLNQSIAKYNSADYRTALTLAQSALNAAVSRGERALRAEAEYMVGLSFLQTGELTRAARYLNHSKVNFGPKGSKKHLDHIAKELDNLRRIGIDTEASAVASEDEAKATGGMDAQIVLNGFIAIASILACLQLWGLAPAKASLGEALFIGIFLFLLFLGNYTVAELVLCRAGKKGLASRLLLFNATFVILALGTLGTALDAKVIAAADFPPALRIIPSAVESLIAGWPSWLFPALIAAGLLLIVLDLALAAGRSPVEALRAIAANGGGDKSLQLARADLDSGEWAKAIVQLSRIDLVKEKQADRRVEILFGLAFAHHKAGHPTEAEGYAKEVLENDSGNREGLYLLGYLQVEANQLGAAEATWRTLYAQVPGYRPPGSGPADRSAKYYLCLTLYRKAMAIMASDIEAGTEALGEVGRLGALDKSVADTLARVHLYRTVESIRRGDWASASSEIELVRGKLELLEKLMADATERTKVAAYSEAALGLVALQSERYAQASTLFVKALDTSNALRPKLSFGGKGGNLLEELLRPLLEARRDSQTIDPRFPRDCRLLAALASLHCLKASAAKPADIVAELAKVRDSLNEGITLSPEFLEGLAILGLLWYHLGPDDDIREKGIEALQKVRDRVSSRFVSQTLADHEKDTEVLKDARQAYFDLLQKYFLSADVPHEEREALKKEVIERMKKRGLYESFMGRGGLDLQADEEPTVQEHVDRARLLDAKIKQVLLSKRVDALSPKIKEKIETLNAQSGILQKTLGDISKLEMEILREALDIM